MKDNGTSIGLQMTESLVQLMPKQQTNQLQGIEESE